MLLFLAIAAGLVALYLLVQSVRPLLESGVVTAAEWQRVEDESLNLLMRRDQLLAELRELEFEAALHKIDARDLAALRRQYEIEAVALDKRIDAQREEYDGRIEAEVEQTLADAAARRAERDGVAPPTKADKPVEVASKPTENAPSKAPTAPAVAETKPARVEPAADAAPAAGGLPDGVAKVVAAGETWTDPAPCGVCDNSMQPDSAFCDGCGSPVMVACASCGAHNRHGARFCKACGSAVRGEGS